MNIIVGLVSILIPVIGGMAVRTYNTRTKCGGKFLYEWIETIGSAIGALFLIAALYTGIVDNPDIMVASNYPKEWTIAAFFQPIGCVFGFFCAKALKLKPKEQRTVALETGVQNFSLIIALVGLLFKGCQRRQVLTFVLIGSLWYVLSSIWIVLFFRFVVAPRDAVEDTGEKSAEMADAGGQEEADPKAVELVE